MPTTLFQPTSDYQSVGHFHLALRGHVSMVLCERYARAAP